MKKLNQCVLFLGLVLLVVLLWTTGVGNLWRALSSLGWRLVPLAFALGVSEFLHVVAWRYCLTGRFRALSLGRLFKISMGSYAINYLAPAASLGGDVAKVALLAPRGGDVPEAVAGVLIGKVTFAIAHLLLIVVGSVWIVRHLDVPRPLLIALFVGGGILALGIVAFLLLQKYGKLGALLRCASNRFTSQRLHRLVASISKVDESLEEFHRTRPMDLVQSVVWHILGYCVGILQTWYLLFLTGSPDLASSVGVWFLGLWFEFLSFAVPLNLGVLEAGTVLAFGAVGRSALVGMTCGIAIRITQLLWTGLGLVAYAFRKPDAAGVVEPAIVPAPDASVPQVCAKSKRAAVGPIGFRQKGLGMIRRFVKAFDSLA